MSSLNKAVKKILKEYVALKNNESLLIVTDENKKSIAEVFLEEGKKISPEVKSIEISIGNVDGQDPPEDIAKEMQKYDVELLITSKSLSHTKARREASKKGVRIASLPNVTEDMLIRFSQVDFNEMYKLGERIKKILEYGNKVHLITDKGTNLYFSVKNMDIFNDIYILKRKFGNIPSGEVCMKPKDKTANGKYVIDLSILDEIVDEPIEVFVKGNIAVSIKGGETAEKLKKTLNKIGEKAYNIAEFGIGINPKAIITGNVLEDEKVLGTVHFAFGNDLSYGGNNDVPIHIDGIIDKPTVFIDDKKIMEKGKFLI